MNRKLFCLVIGLMLLIPIAYSADQIIINSRDWKDVYSAMNYAQLLENTPKANFIMEESRAVILLDMLDKKKREVLLFESQSVPYVKNYARTLEGDGYDVEEFGNYKNLNLEIIEKSETTISNFILMDERFPYNAISVGPYANLEKYYVIFASAENIDDIENVLDDTNVKNVIIYGYVDREVNDAMEKYSPTVINKGDKYSNNLEIVRKFLGKKQVTQVTMTNGMFIEPLFFEGEHPVIFIGNSNIPDETLEFLKDTKFETGVLVGSNLMALAKLVKDETGMKVMVKYAKGVNQQQYTLDMINLPRLDYSPQISDIIYNLVTGELLVTIDNDGTSPVMIRATIAISDNENNTISTAGDNDVSFIPGSGTVTLSYEMDLQGREKEELEVRVDLLYGEDSKALDNLRIKTTELTTLSINDNSEIEVVDFYYDPSISRFVITIKNVGDDSTYINPFIDNFMLNERIQRIGTDDIKKLDSEETAIMKIKTKLSNLDIEDNEDVLIKVRYGVQKRLLLKQKEAELEMKVKTGVGTYVIIGGAVLLILIIIAILIWLIVFKRRKNKHEKHVARHPPPPPPPK